MNKSSFFALVLFFIRDKFRTLLSAYENDAMMKIFWKTVNGWKSLDRVLNRPLVFSNFKHIQHINMFFFLFLTLKTYLPTVKSQPKNFHGNIEDTKIIQFVIYLHVVFVIPKIQNLRTLSKVILLFIWNMILE